MIYTLSTVDCYAGPHLYNIVDMSIGSVSVIRTGNRRTGNDNTNSGFYLNHCKDVEIAKIRSIGETIGAMTRNGSSEVFLDVGNNNVKALNATVGSSNNGATALTAIGTNILLGDPRLANGTNFTPYTTGGTNVSTFRYGLT